MGLFNDVLGDVARWATNPLIDVPDVDWIPGSFVERGLSELTSPIGLASAALFPVSGGASLGLRGAAGVGARLGTRIGGEAAVNAAGNAAGSFVNDRLPENTPGALRLAANLGAGALAGGAVSSGISGGTVGRGLKRLNAATDDAAVAAADPTALARGASPDFDVVGRGVGKAAPDFKMLKPKPGKSPSDVLGRLPDNAELVISPQRLLELEDNLPAQRVWEELAPNQQYRWRARQQVTGELMEHANFERAFPAMAGVDPLRVDSTSETMDALGSWWRGATPARRKLERIDSANRGDLPFHVARMDRSDVSAFSDVYSAGAPMRARLRQLSGSDEIVLYRGQMPIAGVSSFAPPQAIESYTPLAEKAASFAYKTDAINAGTISEAQLMNTPILTRRVKIDDILGTLGRTPDGTSEFVVLGRSLLHPKTFEQITGISTEIPRLASIVDPKNVSGVYRSLTQRAGLVP